MKNPLLEQDGVSLIGLGTMMIQRAVVAYMNHSIKKSGLTISQIYTLYIVGELRGDNISHMARKAAMDRSTLTRAVSTMKKYISVHKDGINNRDSYPALKKAGADFLEKWMPRVLELEQGLSIPTGNPVAFIQFINFFSSEIVDLKKKARSVIK